LHRRVPPGCVIWENALMSYARFGEKECDVYVFLHTGGFLSCCGCWLEPEWDPAFATTAEMIAHLEAHKAAGHLVPDYTFDELRADALENDAWIAKN
jgi:hypothetical protein